MFLMEQKRNLLLMQRNEPWKVLEYCAGLGEIYDIVIEDMVRQARGLKG